MRILLVSLYFPPANAMASVRTGKLAKFLLAQGHDVRIITAESTGPPKTLPLEVPFERVLYTPWWDINWFPRVLQKIWRRLLGRRSDRDLAAKRGTAASNAPKAELSHGWSWRETFYRSFLNWPDQWIGWLPFALREARKNWKDWRPEIVYASSPPPTGLIIGKLLAKRYGCPWIAELRDRWIDDPYRRYPTWRNRLEERLLERGTLASTAAIVTVSEPWARFYARKYGKPTEAIYNGFDAADYPSGPGLGAAGSAFLKIVYTGAIYPGRRDPSALFKALQLMGVGSDDIRIEFYGTDESRISPLAARHDVSHLVAVYPQIAYLESVALQQQADILLLIQWNDPREQGNVPGKLFEYLGARRPILGLGLEDGVPATIIAERAAGFFSNDPHAIANRLETWLDVKRQTGHIAPLPEAARAGFARDQQFLRLETFLTELLESTKKSRDGALVGARNRP